MTTESSPPPAAAKGQAHGETAAIKPAKRRLPPEVSIFLVLVAMALAFEILGWIFVGQSFLYNYQRLRVIVLQVAVTGIIAVGVTQVIIAGGIDLSSGSVLGMTTMIATSLAQTSEAGRPVYPSLIDLPVIVPILVGVLGGVVAGGINGSLIAFTKIPPFIATLGMMVSARGFSLWYTHGNPISSVSESYAYLGTGAYGWMPVLIFLFVAAIAHIALRYTRYGKFTYAIGANPLAARVSGINVDRHLIIVYTVAGALSALAGVVFSARSISGQAGNGVGFELDAIAATVIGGTSLAGGVGRMTGTVIGTIILGVLTSGFTFLNIDAYFQQIIKGIVIVAAVVADQYRQRKRRSV